MDWRGGGGYGPVEERLIFLCDFKLLLAIIQLKSLQVIAISNAIRHIRSLCRCIFFSLSHSLLTTYKYPRFGMSSETLDTYRTRQENK